MTLKLYTLRVELEAAHCEIEIAGTHTLEQLHETIEGAFGRNAKRPWAFETGRKTSMRRYGPPDLGDDMADDASETAFEDLKLRAGDTFAYVFDVDDPRAHTIEITHVSKASRTGPDPRIAKLAAGAPPAPPPPAEPKRAAARPAAATSAQAIPARDAQAAACSYILVALLQRLEVTHPGLTSDLLAGIEADRAAVDPRTPGHDFIDQIFDEALKTVRQARR